MALSALEAMSIQPITQFTETSVIPPTANCCNIPTLMDKTKGTLE